MERIYKNISLDVYDDITSQLTLSVKQGDTTRGIRVTLTDHGKVFNVPDNCYAVFSARKSNGVFISEGCTIQNNSIIYDFSDAVVSTATQIDCELTVYSSNNNKITSPSFMIFVYRTLEEEYAGEVVESNSFTVLNDLISTATETISNVNEVAERTTAIAEEAAEATEQARASVVNIKKTEDGKLQLLDAENNVIDTIDVCYMDNDTIYRYNNGVLRVVGIKDMNTDETFRMWIGTTKKWQAISEYDDNTFYWITDDATFDEVVKAINALNESFTELENALTSGELVVKNAQEAGTSDALAFKDINSITDLNDVTECGDYVRTNTESRMWNYPTDEKAVFHMSVKNSGGVMSQEITDFNAYSPNKFIRIFTKDTWGQWERIAIGSKEVDITNEPVCIYKTGTYVVEVIRAYPDSEPIYGTGVIRISNIQRTSISTPIATDSMETPFYIIAEPDMWEPANYRSKLKIGAGNGREQITNIIRIAS